MESGQDPARGDDNVLCAEPDDRIAPMRSAWLNHRQLTREVRATRAPALGRRRF